MRDYVALAAQYQADVLSGEIPACKWVRLACERNRRDLDRQETPAFRYVFDPDAARRICQMAEMLPHVKGPKAFIIGQDELERPIWNPLVLEPWQCWLLTTLFGWKHAAGSVSETGASREGLRRFRVALSLIPRKNAKSTLAAVVVLYMLVADGESGAECYSAATTRDQAKAIAEIAWEMARRSPGFREYFGVRMGSETSKSLSVPANGSKFMPLSADAHTLDSLNVSLAAIDELHAHKTAAVWNVLDTATGARTQPMIFAITTAGIDIGGVCHQKMAYLEKVLDGIFVDEAFFGINYTIDSAPHTDKIEAPLSFLELCSLCNCERVPLTLIEKYWREACVKHATTIGTDGLAPSDVNAILTNLQKLEVCANSATTGGGSKQILVSRKSSADQVETGLNEIAIGATPQTRDTGRAPRTDAVFSISSDLPNTESRESNSIAYLKSSSDSVRSANHRRLYMWITATAAELFGDCYVRNATARSAFSETLRNVYSAHSAICDVKLKSRLHESAVEIDRAADDIRDVVVQRKANPNWGVSVDPDDLARKVNAAQLSQDDLNDKLTKHFNVWIRTESSWMSGALWQTCARPALRIEDFKQYPCWIGVDLAEVRDIAATVALFKLPDGYAMFGRFYLPKAAVDRSPIAGLPGWVHAGRIIETEGDQADFRRIQADILEWCDTYQVREIDFDRALAAHMQQDLKAILEPRMGRDAVEKFVVTVPQGVVEFDPAMKMVERLVLGKSLQHDGNEAMAWMISNIVVERNYKQEIYPRKAGGKDSHNKIDGPVALFTCLSQAMRAQVQEPQFQMIIL